MVERKLHVGATRRGHRFRVFNPVENEFTEDARYERCAVPTQATPRLEPEIAGSPVDERCNSVHGTASLAHRELMTAPRKATPTRGKGGLTVQSQA
jgi:hypothetical protein